MSTIPKSIATDPPLTRDDVLDGRDVAELLHLPISTVLEYARRGLLPGRKLGTAMDLSCVTRSGGSERPGGGQVGGVRRSEGPLQSSSSVRRWMRGQSVKTAS